VLKRLFTVRNLLILAGIAAIFLISSALGLKVPGPVVEIAPQVIFHIGPLAITNTLFCAWLAMLVLIIVSWRATRRIPANLDAASNADLVPHGVQNVMELVVEVGHDLVKSIAGGRVSKFFPVVMTIFLFVIVSNWFSVLPLVGSIGWLRHPEGVGTAGYIANGHILTATPAKSPEEGYVLANFFRPPSTDLNFTIALALISVGLSWYFGIRAQGGGFFKQFFDINNFRRRGAAMGVVFSFAGFLELVGQFTRIISFSFRLFGNIFAGEVLLAVMAFLIPYVVSLPFYGLEVFVGFIQAAVFMMLTLVFFVTATLEHGGDEHH
jgi:F-type H+-transporting ATPase subunit a